MKKLLLAFCICISVIATAQSGVTWAARTSIAANSYSNNHPRIALDAAGNPMVLWVRMSDESVFFSRWSGSAFTMPVKLNPAGMTVAGASWMGPDIASKGDTVYVVMRQTPESVDTSKHIFIVSSFDGGMSFSAPVQVDHIGDSITRFPAVTIDANGNPIVAFMKFNAAFMDSRWAVTKSNDLGASFSNDVKASGWSGPSSTVCDCCPGTIISAGNTTAMLYRDNLSNIRDIWTGISTNNAATFSRGFTADTTNFMITFCPASGPDGVIVGDTVYSVFYGGASGNDRTYLSRSSLSTGAVQSVTRLKGEFPGLSQQNYPRIATDGTAMVIAWKQTVSGNSQLPVLFTNNIANGLPAVYDTLALANITNSDVAVHDGKVYVVWEDDNSGTVRFRSGTYTPAVVTTGISDINEKAITEYPNPNTGMIHISGSVQGSILISDIEGRNVLTTAQPDINISSIPSGVYLLKYVSGSRQIVRKIVKE